MGDLYLTIRNLVLILLLFFNFTTGAWGQPSGEDLYKQRCAACHSVGGGRLVGPDLAGIHDRRSEDWLIRWTRSPSEVLRSGDETAKQIVDEYQMVMPDQPMSDNEIKSVLSYIKGVSASQPSNTAEAVVAPLEVTREEILAGQNLFQGKARFEAGGPACISCHTVDHAAMISGGILAKGLTTAYSRLGEAALRSIIMTPPFPVMNAAFSDKPVTDKETRALIGFLQFVDRENTLHQPREYGWAMFGAGSAGVALLLGFFSIIGRRRKRNSVNQEIYDRQVKSE